MFLVLTSPADRLHFPVMSWARMWSRRLNAGLIRFCANGMGWKRDLPTGWVINRLFPSSINFARTERKHPAGGPARSAQFRVRVTVSLLELVHGASCLLEGLPQALPRFVSNRALPGQLGTGKDQLP